MELCIKKIYCPSCRKLVKPIEQWNADIIIVLCPLCNEPIRTWDGNRWRLKKGVTQPSKKIETDTLDKKEQPTKDKKKSRKVTKEK